jgi:hypothetical protein
MVSAAQAEVKIILVLLVAAGPVVRLAHELARGYTAYAYIANAYIIKEALVVYQLGDEVRPHSICKIIDRQTGGEPYKPGAFVENSVRCIIGLGLRFNIE